MAKIDINALKKSTELEKSEQAEPKAESAELTDNAIEEAEDINEIKEEQTEEKESGKVIVRYVGSGIWKDSKGDLWAKEDKTKNILTERQYSKSEYETREDIKFMVSYGAMQITEVE